MHDPRSPPTADQRAATRERRRLAQRRYRQRLDAGRMTVAVEIDGDVIEMLINSHWLDAGECHDRRKIGMALAAMVAEAAKR
jgi:hypothetical protein